MLYGDYLKYATSNVDKRLRNYAADLVSRIFSNLLIKDYLPITIYTSSYMILFWHKRLNILYEQRYLNSNQIRQKYLSKKKRNLKDEKEIEEERKKKEHERMKLMFNLYKTYGTVNVISMSSLCLTYVKLICQNLYNIIVICHIFA